MTCTTDAQQDVMVLRKKKLPTKGAPEIVREGNAQVKIYASPVRGRPRFIVAYRGVDGRRRTQSFSNHDRAKQEAEVKAVGRRPTRTSPILLPSWVTMPAGTLSAAPA